MRNVAMLMLIGCGSTTKAPAPANQPVAVASPTDPLVYCDLAVQMIDELTACTKSDSFEMFKSGMIRDRGLRPLLARKSAAFCATFMEQLLGNPEAPTCTYTVAPRRQELTVFIDGYLAERTPVTPTGDERRDRALRALAKHRDEVCACPDQACTRRVEQAFLDGAIEPVGGGAPEAVRDLTDKLLDEVNRCAGEMRWGRKK